MAYPAWDPDVIAINSANAKGQPSGFNPPVIPGKTLTILGENVPSAWITIPTMATATSTTNKSRQHNIANPDPAMTVVDLAATRCLSGTSVATLIATGLVALLFEFAMIDVPDEPVTQGILHEVLSYIKIQACLNTLLMDMAVRTGDFHNIVPINLLNPELTLYENAAAIKRVLAKRFGFRRPS